MGVVAGAAAANLITGGSAFEDMRAAIIACLVWLQNATASGLAKTITDIMTFRNGFDDTVVNIIIQNVAGPIGFILMVIYALTGILQKQNSRGDVGIEDLIAPCIFLVIGDIVITNATYIISWLMGLSNGVAKLMDEAFQGMYSEENVEAMAEGMYKDESTLMLIMLVLVAFFGWLFSILAKIALFVVAMTAKLELLVRLGFAPIGLAQLADEANRHEGFRYAKKLLASALYCSAIIAAINIGTWMPQQIAVMAPTDLADGGNLGAALTKLQGTLMMLVGPFVAIGSVSTAKAAINEALGA